ncbi:hypothetical protein T484DRAFT_1975400 [Baffinella frigidus]|nr:hypothetical protein T484DRAFT_1975400 [Cryptophyta sp. CCMP2293]
MEGRVASMEAELETLAREQAARDDDLRKRVAAALSLASNASRDSAAVCSALQELERLLHPSVRPPPPTPLPPAPQPHQQQPMGLWFPPPPTTPLHMYAAQSPARYFPEVAAAPSWGQPQPHYAFPQPTWQPPQPSWQPPVADGGWFPPGFPERFPDGVAAPGDGEGFQGGRVGQGPAPSVHLRMWLDRVTSEKPFGERAGAARA